MIKRFIKRLLNKTGYRVTSTKYLLKQLEHPTNNLELDFDHVLSDYLINRISEKDNFTFIQIGAFDGVMCDPLVKYLNRYHWEGVMLEPQPGPYSKLKERYSHRAEIIIKNAAISARDGRTTLYALEGNDLPEWANGMASFSKENITKHSYLIPGIDRYIKEIEVEAITFQKLLEEKGVHKLDLLQTDTEGFDGEILRMFPFDRIKPKLIHFESKHIERRELELLLDMLIVHGYKVARDRGEDMMAVLDEKSPS